MKDYKYDKEVYMHGACQYFALAASEIFGGSLCFWLDVDENFEDYEAGRHVLCHMYLKIGPNLYLDADGVFRNIKERENDFEFNEMNIIETCTNAEAKRILKDLRIPFTDVELKRNVREFLRDNMLVLHLNDKGNELDVGICIGYYDDRPQVNTDVFGYVLYSDKTFTKYIHFTPKNRLSAKYVKSLGFKENKQWWYKK